MDSPEINIIADVAGQFLPLRRLIEKIPEVPFLCVGDLVDRGPDSRAVVDFVMKKGDSLLGNHEDMMLDFYYDKRKYPLGCWFGNGGRYTFASYEASSHLEFIKNAREHVKWINSRRLIHEQSGLVVTHAPIAARHELIDDSLVDDHQFDDGFHILWNRAAPRQRHVFQAFGHNSNWGIEWFIGDERGALVGQALFLREPKPQPRAWAVCLDDSRKKQRLTGMHWPSREIYQEAF